MARPNEHLEHLYQADSMATSMIPVTILTGFLGSGKTTLLKRILNEKHGMKIAVIENEFGEENIDNEILVQDSTEQIIQMSNGCICCTIRGDLARVLGDLAQQKRDGKLDFDRVVIETTGLANPGPVAQTFFMDNEIADEFLLDAIITLVDAKHGNHQLDEHEVVQRQVGFADRLFITKADLVDEDELADLRHRVLHMNPRAQIKQVNFGEADIKEVFDLRGFNLNAKLEIDPDFLAEDDHAHDHDHAHHDHDHDHDHAHAHAHSHSHAHAPAHADAPHHPDSVLFIENVGNLVCPTSYDLGEAHKIVLLSVTEGEEKPLKYPGIFFKADLMALTKVDLLPYVPFQASVAEANARSIHPDIEIVRVSSTLKTGLDGWLEWIDRRAASAATV